MKRHNNIFEKVSDFENYLKAYNSYVRSKENRKAIKEYANNLNSNLYKLMLDFMTGRYKTSEYTKHMIYQPKVRLISKLPVANHIQQWAVLNYTEDIFVSTYIRNSCSCVKGRGTHDFFYRLKDCLNDVENTTYFVQLDVHHFFPNIDHEIMKKRITTKIKDKKLLEFFNEFIDSYDEGLPLGVKLSQILANFLIADLDHKIITYHDIIKDKNSLSFYIDKYINDCIAKIDKPGFAEEVGKGICYLKDKFLSFLKEPLRYFRFADNIIILHKDKTFLHIIKDIVKQRLKEDYLLDVNKGCNVRPVHTGIDVCGYVFYHDRVLLRKRNKQALCREVKRLRKRGYNDYEIQQMCASRIGFASHADVKHLLATLGLKPYDVKRKGKKKKQKSKNHKNVNKNNIL